jgi:hypothetical protein
MRSNRTFSFVMVAVISGLLGFGSVVQAQAQQYKARLSVVPISNAGARNNIDESSTVFAKGEVTATLNGSKLTVTGAFEGFKSAASIAQIHQGVAMGVRGPVVFDLTVTKDTKGSISGTFDLTPEQVNLLKSNRLYVQIHNQNTPDGALWGWLLK